MGLILSTKIDSIAFVFRRLLQSYIISATVAWPAPTPRADPNMIAAKAQMLDITETPNSINNLRVFVF